MIFLGELLTPADEPIAVGDNGLSVSSGVDAPVTITDNLGNRYRLSRASAFALGSALISKSLRGLYEQLPRPFSEVSVVLTGRFQCDRKMLEYELRDFGFTLSNRVTGDSIVICGELPGAGTSKSQIAAEVGALTLNEAELTALIALIGMQEIAELDEG